MNKFYYKDGTISSEHSTSKHLHREGGPAVERADGGKRWYIDGKLHREDGPALEYNDGLKYWYIDGKRFTEEDFNITIEEIRQLPLALRLIDPREWVRKL